MEPMPERLTAYTAQQMTNLESLDAVRWFSVCLKHNGQNFSAATDYVQRWPRTPLGDRLQRALQRGTLLEKAGTDPGAPNTWGSNLSVTQPSLDGIVTLSNAASLLGRLDPLVRHAAFGTTVVGQTGAPTFRWTGAGAPKSVGTTPFISTTLQLLKVAGIIAISQELERLASLASVAAIRTELVNALAFVIDQSLTDPTSTGVTDVTPASITSTATTIASAGSSEANTKTDWKLLVKTFTANNPGAGRRVGLTSPDVMTAILSAFNYPSWKDGDSLFAIPMFTSAAVGSRIILVDAAALVVADDKQATIDTSKQATVEFNTIATSPQVASTVLTSLWHSNMLGVRCERFVNWKMARNSAVTYTNVSYV